MLKKPAFRVALILLIGIPIGYVFATEILTDAGVERQLEDARRSIDRLQAQKDSISTLRQGAADSLKILQDLIQQADSARNEAAAATAQARRELQNIPTYENATPDALAHLADSLFRAGADLPR